MDSTPFSLITACTTPRKPKPPLAARGASTISSLALLGASTLHALPPGTVPTPLGARAAGALSTGLAAAARVMHVEPGPRNEKAKKKGVFKKVKSFFFGSKKREGKETSGADVDKRGRDQQSKEAAQQMGGYDASHLLAFVDGPLIASTEQPTEECPVDSQLGHYTASHLLAFVDGPLVVGTADEIEAVPMQHKTREIGIQATPDCLSSLPRGNPASKDERVEGDDVAIGSAGKIEASSMRGSVKDRGTRGRAETKVKRVSVVPEEDVVHEEAEGSTKANRGRGVETWRYTTPMKQSKRAESVPARITTAGNINRDTTGMNETGINDEPKASPMPEQSDESTPNTTPNASRLSWNSLQSTRASSLEADDLLNVVRDETKRQCAEEFAAEKIQMEQQHEKNFVAEREQSAVRDKQIRQECGEIIAAEREAHKVELAKEESELEATKNAEQKSALIAQKQILEGQHNKETAAKVKEHEAQNAAKDKEHEAHLATVREFHRHQSNQQMVPKREVEAIMEFVRTFPQGFETLQTDGTKLLCGLDAVIKTMESMHPTLPRPTVPQLQALLKSDEWQKQIEDFTVKEYDPEKFSAYEIDMTNENDFRVDQLGSLLTLWGHTDGRNLNLRMGCFVQGQGPELLLHANEDPGIIVWIHNDAVNLDFPDGSKGHYKGMKPFDRAGRAEVEKATAALTEDLLKQQSKDQETIAQLNQKYELVVVEKENLGTKVAGLETANTNLERNIEQFTDHAAGFETDKASLESKVEQMVADVTKFESDKASLGRKVEKLQEGVVFKENTKLKELYKASIKTTVEQATTIAELRSRPACQCGGLRPAEGKRPRSTPGQPAKIAVKEAGRAKMFSFGGPAVKTVATTDAFRSGELAAKPINKAKKPRKDAKSSGTGSDAPTPETTDYVERTNIFDIGDSAVKAGDKARALNTDGSVKKPGLETKKPSPFTFGASTMDTGEESGNPGFQFTAPAAKPAGPSEPTIPFRFKKSAEKAGEKSSLFSFGVPAEQLVDEAIKPNHSNSEQPAKRSGSVPKGSGPGFNAPDLKAADFFKGPNIFGLGKPAGKTGEKEKEAFDGGKLTDPLSRSKETEKAAYELGRAETEKETAVVNEELKEVRHELAETKWSLGVTTKELDNIIDLRERVEKERDQLRSDLNNQLSKDTRTISALVKENSEWKKTIDFLQDEAEDGNDLSDKQVETIEELKSTVAERDATIEKLKNRSPACTCRTGSSTPTMIETPSTPQSEEPDHAQIPLTTEPQVKLAPTKEHDALEEERDNLRTQCDNQAYEINRLRNLPEQCDIEQISAESAERFKTITEQERLIEKLRNLPGRANELDQENQELQDHIHGLNSALKNRDYELQWAGELIRFLEGFQTEVVAELLLLMRSNSVAYQKLDNCAEESDELELWRSGHYRIVDPPTIDQGAQAGRDYDSETTPESDPSHSSEPGAGDTTLEIEQDGIGEPQPSSGEACQTGYGTTRVDETGYGDAELPNDDESEVGDEVANSSIYDGSEAGDVVMGHVNDGNGLVDDLADRMEQLNIETNLMDALVPVAIRQVGPAQAIPPPGYWARVNNSPPGNSVPWAGKGSWGWQAEMQEEEL